MPDITLIIWLSVLLQVTAVILAIRLISLTKKALAWILLSFAFVLMASRRTLDLLFGQNLIEDPAIHNLSTKSVALAISVLLVAGIFLIKRIFEQQQQDEEQIRKLSLVVEQSPSATVIFNPEGLIEYANPKFCELNNTPARKLLGQTPLFLSAKFTPPSTLNKIWNRIRIGGVWKGDFCNTDQSGQHIWSRAVISPIRNNDETITHYIATFEDITIEKQQRQAIKQLSLHDALTELPNRTYFQDSLQQAINLAKCSQQTLSVILLDINDFKSINNTLGHITGDIILREVSNRLNFIAEKDPGLSLARLGGDEFLLYSTNTTHKNTHALSELLLHSIQQSFFVENRNFELTANIGYCFFPEHGSNADELIKCADVAMYAAKASNDCIVPYMPTLGAGKLKQLELNSHFRQAIDEDEFVLYYQPQMDFSNKKIIGAEALVRWLHPEYGMMSPDDFIELAQQSGNIYHITEWVITNGLCQLAKWHRDGFNLELSINLSATDIQNPELVNLLETEMIRNNIEPIWLNLEITENSLMLYNKQTLSALKRLSDLGLKISIDDFGTGYSSLQYLTKMPVSHIKIDKSFVMQMLHNDQDAVIVRSTAEMAHNLGLKITAEGIENQETQDILEIIRCDFAQGYHLAKPMNNSGFISWLNQYNQRLKISSPVAIA